MKRETKLILTSGILLFLINFFLRPEEELKMTWPTFGAFITTLLIMGALAFFWKKSFEGTGYCLMSAAVLALIQLTCQLKTRGYDNISLQTLGKCSILLGIALLLGILILTGRRVITEREIYFVIVAAVLMRFFYAVTTQANYFQNDIGFFGEQSSGHLGYIYQIYATGRLPNVNPIDNGQFYHPPLHHALSAILIKICVLLGLNVASGDEYMQMLSIFYGVVTLVYIDKLAKQLKLSEYGRFIVAVLAGFFPYGIMLHTALNNDPLVTMLMIMALYYTLKWYEKPCFKSIIAMAVCIGCAMMTKLSGALIAPAMAVPMLAKAWQMRKQWKSIFCQFLCFGCIAFPLGLWHSVLQNLKYGMPLGYVLQLPLDLTQSLVDFTTRDRFLNFSGAFDSLIVSWNRFGDYIEYNIFMAIWKFSTFGETFFYSINPVIQLVSTILFAGIGLLFILLIISGIWYLFSKKEPLMPKVLLLGSMAIIGIMYLKFCIDYPFVCTMNVRYIMVALFTGILLVGKLLSNPGAWLHTVKTGKLLYYGIINIGLLLYVISTVLMYWNMEMIVY